MDNLAASKLRTQLAEPDSIIFCPGVQDGLSARVCLQQGFKNLYMAGAGTAMSLLGVPDLGLTTADDMVRNASMIAPLDRTAPLIADADTGFGGPAMTERYILAGVAGLHIEDQVTTKRCGHLLGKELVDTSTFTSRVRGAAAARSRLNSDIVIIARTDSLQSLGFEEAVLRLQAAVQADADVAFLEGIQDKEQMKQIVEAMKPTPCLLNMVAGGVTPLINSAEARHLGFRIVIWPCFAMTAAYLAYQQAAKELQTTGAIAEHWGGPDGAGIVGGVRESFELCGLTEFTAFDKEMGGKTFTDGV
ncbi:Pyruvate/Phosphoenolpyruvate kinase-like domain-containing protein [Podospora aff. communis PSN243]|uniref:Pyruvate/Phosphoenolpyruvate kinase-like domain-containing protein n=1 Tax=Podospora aff. communis PSN243 TaxID=3040156 RepID=A0AAV9H6J3_9PEZI|nr:Pyruvate/Phosphoenolpyruvate kinase-like domain-containing protein [Podospora aff. communis PSN243]